MMKKIVAVLLALSMVAGAFTLVTACIDDDDGRQACEALASVCLPVGKTAKCDRVAINSAPNGDKVEDCIQAATECDAATACYETLQR